MNQDTSVNPYVAEVLPLLDEVDREILLYHLGSEVGLGPNHIAPNLVISPKTARQHLTHLATQGCAQLVYLNSFREEELLAGRGYILSRFGQLVREQLANLPETETQQDTTFP